MSDAIRIGNCSGYYGDRLAAAKEMVDGGPIDVLTGDYLAELTMTILYNQQQSRGQHMGYVGTFLKQVKDVMATCLDRNIKIVTNAGGLNPKGMADEVEKILQEQGLTANVAYIDGDDLMSDIEHLTSLGQNFTNIDKGIPLSDTSNQVVTANTYFGAWAIKEALPVEFPGGRTNYHGGIRNPGAYDDISSLVQCFLDCPGTKVGVGSNHLIAGIRQG